MRDRLLRLRMYKGPPPEVSSEQFYETEQSRGFARGFSIQTVSPQPIGWAEHVLADGRWGKALREYMRDYNHWTCIGVLNELFPHPENRVTLADDTDPYGIPVARFDYTLNDNDKANVAYSTSVIKEILQAAGPRTFSPSTAMHTWSAADGWARGPRRAWSTPTTASGGWPTCSCVTGACALRRARPTRR